MPKSIYIFLSKSLKLFEKPPIYFFKEKGHHLEF